MNRRGLGVVVAALCLLLAAPLPAEAQQAAKVARIGYLRSSALAAAEASAPRPRWWATRSAHCGGRRRRITISDWSGDGRVGLASRAPLG